MTDETTLAKNASETMMRAAAEWWRANVSAKAPGGDYAALIVEELRAEAKPTVEEALRDAKDAIEAGLGGYATATFNASLTLGGVRAAKRAAARLGVRSEAV